MNKKIKVLSVFLIIGTVTLLGFVILSNSKNLSSLFSDDFSIVQ